MPEERAALGAERRALAAISGPRVAVEDVGALVLPVIETFKGRNPDGAADQVALGYAVALTGLPRPAVAEACRRVLAGEAGLDRHFRPTPAELAELARRIHSAVDIGLRRIEELLAAPVDPPVRALTAEERRRIEETLASFQRRDVVQAQRPACDGGHARRVAEDLARRRSSREAAEAAS